MAHKYTHVRTSTCRPRLINDNFAPSSSGPPTFLSHPLAYLRNLLPYDSETRTRLQATAQHNAQGSGYMIEQATKPQTIGYSLADSPVGLLAWIYEKLVSWTDEYPWTDDEGTSGTALTCATQGSS